MKSLFNYFALTVVVSAFINVFASLIILIGHYIFNVDVVEGISNYVHGIWVMLLICTLNLFAYLPSISNK